MNLEQIVSTAVTLPHFDSTPARRAMSPMDRIPTRSADMQGTARRGAVLIVLFAEGAQLKLILIKRRDDLPFHPGQISFPGGRLDPGEQPEACALRETHEEIGIEAGNLHIAGSLDPVYIHVSDFHVHPFVAWHCGIPDTRPDTNEVDAVFRIPLAMLSAPAARTHAMKNIRGSICRVPGFTLFEHHIWGATAMLLSEMIERLTAAGWRE